MATYLLSKMSPNRRFKISPLPAAATGCHVQLLKLLLNDPRVVPKNDAIHHSIENSKNDSDCAFEMIQAILAHPNFTSRIAESYDSPVAQSVERGYSKVVEL